MDVLNRPISVRSAMLLVIFLLHGGLTLILLRAKPDRDHRRSPGPELSTTVFFLEPEPRVPLPPPEAPQIPHRPARELQHHLRADAPVSSPDTSVAAESPGAAASAAVDWYGEAQRSAAEITSRGRAGRAAQAPPSPTARVPWDSRPLFESTDHGMTLQIPVEIPGDLIDHCSANLDSAHGQQGQAEALQLKCALGKQPARGDLFDPLGKRPAPPK
jgi:hypothetical protein